MCCDWRVMTEQGYIGLNEVAIGISVPEKWCNLREQPAVGNPVAVLGEAHEIA